MEHVHRRYVLHSLIVVGVHATTRAYRHLSGCSRWEALDFVRGIEDMRYATLSMIAKNQRANAISLCEKHTQNRAEAELCVEILELSTEAF